MKLQRESWLTVFLFLESWTRSGPICLLLQELLWQVTSCCLQENNFLLKTQLAAETCRMRNQSPWPTESLSRLIKCWSSGWSRWYFRLLMCVHVGVVLQAVSVASRTVSTCGPCDCFVTPSGKRLIALAVM